MKSRLLTPDLVIKTSKVKGGTLITRTRHGKSPALKKAQVVQPKPEKPE